MGTIWQYVLTFIIFIVFATFHEYGHGWMAYRLGDSTAKLSGRLSLNPLVHIDLMWTIIMPAMLIITTGHALGSAKPVPVNPYRLRDPKRDMLWVGLAGPATNIIWALIIMFLMKIGFRTGILSYIPVILVQGIRVSDSPIYLLLFMCFSINVILLVFNLLPIPPLDGSRIAESLLPDRHAAEYSRLGRFGFIILILLVMSGILGRLFGLVLKLVMMVFTLPWPLKYLQ